MTIPDPNLTQQQAPPLTCEPMGGAPEGAVPGRDGRQVFWDAGELWTTQFPEPRWAVPTLIPDGLTVLAGAPKIGKSWLALCIALGIAHGGKLLGQYHAGQPGRVLYLALEDPPRRLKDRLRQLSDRPPQALTFAVQWQQGFPGFADLADHLMRNPETRVVVVDTLQRLRGMEMRQGSNAYADDYETLCRLKEIADRFAVAMIVLHHVRKGNGADGDFLQEVSGTMGITGAVDTVIVLKRMRGRSDAELKVTGRDVEEQELALAWDDRAGWQVMGAAMDYRDSEKRATIIRVLRDNGKESMTPKAICEDLGIDPKSSEASSIRHLLGKMVDDGKVRKTDYGAYALASPVHTVRTNHTSPEEEDGEPEL